jgi:hypothetical protein
VVRISDFVAGAPPAPCQISSTLTLRGKMLATVLVGLTGAAGEALSTSS